MFDCRAGEGSYGSVYKALHKESGQVLAIKQVPVESDLGLWTRNAREADQINCVILLSFAGEIIKEISIMQACDSTYVVKYYGSYFKGK